MNPKEEDIRKAYEEGNDDIKKMLKTLHPQLGLGTKQCLYTMQNKQTGLILWIEEINGRGTATGFVLKKGGYPDDDFDIGHRSESWMLTKLTRCEIKAI